MAAEMANNPTPPVWQAGQLRFTAFPVTGGPDVVVGHRGVWRTLQGADPDQTREKRQPAELTERGPLGPNTLILQARERRVDLLLQPTEPTSDDDETRTPVSTLGEFSATLESFMNVLRRWPRPEPSQNRSYKRVALGAVLHLPVSSTTEALRQFLPLLPAVRLDPEGAADFLYRINRPREDRFGPETIRLNRLATWEAVNVTYSRVRISAEGVEPEETLQSENRAQLTLDLNTDAARQTQLPPEHLVEILDRLGRMGLELAAKGDQP